MKKLIFCGILISVLSTSLYAQREAAIWYFGDGAGLDFNSGAPVALTNGQLVTEEGCSSISDKNGNLLFYTDGSKVYDKTHQVMPNGIGLWGNESSTQSAIIVPKPKNPYIYYIFTVDQPLPVYPSGIKSSLDPPPNHGLNYSQVDMRLNNGLGDIVNTEKNIHLITYNPNDSEELKYQCSEKVTAVQHGDGISFWVITHFINNFYSFKISPRGVDKTPIKTTTSLNIPLGGYQPDPTTVSYVTATANAIGYLKASPNGKKIAIANTASRRINEKNPKTNLPVYNTGNVVLFDFNSANGTVSNEVTLLTKANPYGVEFSSKTKKLYVTTNKYKPDGTTPDGSLLLQYNLNSSNIPASELIIDNSTYNAGALQLAIDEKIYRAGYLHPAEGSNKLSVINNPDLDGTSSNYRQNAIDLKVRLSRLGLPPFITSLFLFTFEYEFNCLGDSTHFSINTAEAIDSVVWDFGDGTSSTDKDAYHIYAAIGDYKVTLIKTVNGEIKDPIEKTITIYEIPKIIATPYKLTQCDAQDSNSTDGFATFNLQLADNPIALGNNDYDIFYYKNIQDAHDDISNINSLNNLYRNTTLDETVFAKVTQPGSSCYTVTEVILHANKNYTLLPEPLHECEVEAGKAIFNLDRKKNDISLEFNLPSDVRLYFYATQNDSFNGTNEVTPMYESNTSTLYIRAENNDGCYGIGKFELVVDPIPNLTQLENITLCEGENPSVELDSDIQFPELKSNYEYLWSTNEETSSIIVSKEGQYTATITNNNGCSTTRTFIVTKSYLAKLNNIIIKDLNTNNNVTVDLENPNNYRYMINYQNGTTTGFQDSNLFEYVPGGIHELIVENKDGCGSVNKSIVILEAPSFFTPNNDGYNDTWNLKGIDVTLHKNTRLYIYDRYGKFIKQLNPLGLGWDGMYHKLPLPSDDYWFTLFLEDGREAKGHFSLKR
ncbi:T9SS type B sorting domain-containing protein [Flavobacterium hiemivividum]|uniref:T9SS type B sorting domain-containing protein n=1 Tax=Flavobacterium hiemivividum TaxID=2541734 RepID=A0A4R5CPJ0_9FLAO|nr:T9SS type B sorting domain-containing protein [Flavobacterium hiemivividum]TDE02372.1 T9SS type B sorting domain-containing protein [Flavobacterium hiemivividum]